MTKARQARFEWEFRAGTTVVFKPTQVRGTLVATSVEVLGNPRAEVLSTTLDKDETDALEYAGEIAEDGGIIVPVCSSLLFSPSGYLI